MKVHKADHVKAVVLERRLQEFKRPGAQVVEVCVRHQRARDWIVSLVAQNSLFDDAQSAGFEPVAVKGTHECEQVDVRLIGQLARHAGHHPARAQQREIKGAAVEGRNLVGRGDLVAQSFQECGLHARLRKKYLCDAQPAADRTRDRRNEGQRAGATGESGGLGVDVSDVARVRVKRRQRDDVLAQYRRAESSVDLLEPARQPPNGWLRARSRRSA